jgi:glucose-1-phosphate thymidylyltransferase
VIAGPKSSTNEYYLTDAFQFMIDHGAKIKVAEVGGWYDCGQVETLLDTNRYLLSTTRGRQPDGGKNVKVHEPVRIAEGVTLENVELGPNVTIEEGTVVRRSRLRDTIVGGDSRIEDSDLSRSVIGSNAVVESVKGSISVGDHSVIQKPSEDNGSTKNNK